MTHGSMFLLEQFVQMPRGVLELPVQNIQGSYTIRAVEGYVCGKTSEKGVGETLAYKITCAAVLIGTLLNQGRYLNCSNGVGLYVGIRKRGHRDQP